MDLKKWFEEGFCQKELQTSLLGFDWESFQTRSFAAHSGDVRFADPPEFIYYGFSALDAYATAVLAAQFSTDSLGALIFTCRLTQPEPDSELCLDVVTSTEHGGINLDQIIGEMASSFPRVLLSKGIDSGAGEFLEGDGCPMRFEYPGRMKNSASPFLRERSKELWPEATLKIMPTDELRERARKIVSFLQDSGTRAGEPN